LYGGLEIKRSYVFWKIFNYQIICLIGNRLWNRNEGYSNLGFLLRHFPRYIPTVFSKFIFAPEAFSYISSVLNVSSMETNQISRNVCSLPQNKGGMGMVNLNHFIKAKQVKCMHNIKIFPKYVRSLDFQASIQLFILFIFSNQIISKSIAYPWNTPKDQEILRILEKF
jgi:hypothetical protein